MVMMGVTGVGQAAAALPTSPPPALASASFPAASRSSGEQALGSAMREARLSQMGFRFFEQCLHLYARGAAFAEDFACPCKLRLRIEITAEHHHEIYLFTDIPPACNSMHGCAFDPVMDGFPDSLLAR